MFEKLSYKEARAAGLVKADIRFLDYLGEIRRIPRDREYFEASECVVKSIREASNRIRYNQETVKNQHGTKANPHNEAKP